MYTKIKLEANWLCLSFFIGVVFTFLLLPNFLLHSSDLDMLLREGDAIQNFLGFAFFRQSKWTWPITYTNHLFYPFGTSIIFTDSYPIVSIILKLFSWALPEFFITFGVVAILNSALMFYSGSLFCRVLRRDSTFAIVGGLFTIISSVFIWRFDGHFSLTSQWLIIFNLLIIIKPSFKLKADILLQMLLIFLACGTHPYLSAMIVALSFGLAWKIATQKFSNIVITVPVFISFILFALFSAWFWGWFSSSFSGVSYGYGFYSANILTLFNPLYGSILLPQFPQNHYQYEGFAYLGLGIIIPLIILLLYPSKKKFQVLTKERLGLICALIGLYIFSLSNVIRFGDFSVTVYPVVWGTKLCNILGIYRASGRFIWPIYYIITFLTLIKLYDLLSKQPKKRIGILIFLLVLQFFDNSYLLNRIREKWNASNTEQSLHAEFSNKIWWNLSKLYGIKHMVLLDSIDDTLTERKFGFIALINHITINKTVIGRNSEAIENFDKVENNNFKQGVFEPDSIYIGLIGKTDLPDNRYCRELDQYVICSQNVNLYLASFGERK